MRKIKITYKHGKIERKQSMPVYTISITSQLCGLPTYTIRWLETNEIIQPSRSNGNQRLFSEQEVALLREVAQLLDQHVNLAGIQIIMKMKSEIRETQL